jgi:hypothetical protein
MAKEPVKLRRTTRQDPGSKKQFSEADDDGVIRVNFDLNRSDHVKLKVYAAKSGCSMADLLRAFVASLKLSGVK